MSFLEPLDVPAQKAAQVARNRAGLPLSKTMEVILTHVLIIIGWLGGAVNGPAVSNSGVCQRRAVRGSPACAH